MEIPKPDGGVRKLGIPTVLDRFIQQAVMQVLQEHWDPTFSRAQLRLPAGTVGASGGGPGAASTSPQGYRWVVDIDLEKFFDRVNHDMLMGRVAKRVEDKRVLKLIRAFLNAGVMEDGLVSPTDEGTPQGGPLSPLLSNLVLDDLDRELEQRGHRFVRYADDCNIYVRSERAGERVMAGVKRFHHQQAQAQGERGQERGGSSHRRRKFLGFSFTSHRRPKRRIAPTGPRAVQGASPGTDAPDAGGRASSRWSKDLAPYLRGWGGYFGFCETPGVLIRPGLMDPATAAGAGWKQWNNGRRRFAELRRLGVSCRLGGPERRWQCHGAWRISLTLALCVALPESYFASLGLPTAGLRGDRMTNRTAVYGPVRTVVWEGWSREAPPYPDPEERAPQRLPPPSGFC